jgi:hypothetical protein
MTTPLPEEPPPVGKEEEEEKEKEKEKEKEEEKDQDTGEEEEQDVDEDEQNGGPITEEDSATSSLLLSEVDTLSQGSSGSESWSEASEASDHEDVPSIPTRKKKRTAIYVRVNGKKVLKAGNLQRLVVWIIEKEVRTLRHQRSSLTASSSSVSTEASGHEKNSSLSSSASSSFADSLALSKTAKAFLASYVQYATSRDLFANIQNYYLNPPAKGKLSTLDKRKRCVCFLSYWLNYGFERDFGPRRKHRTYLRTPHQRPRDRSRLTTRKPRPRVTARQAAAAAAAGGGTAAAGGGGTTPAARREDGTVSTVVKKILALLLEMGTEFPEEVNRLKLLILRKSVEVSKTAQSINNNDNGGLGGDKKLGSTISMLKERRHPLSSSITTNTRPKSASMILQSTSSSSPLLPPTTSILSPPHFPSSSSSSLTGSTIGPIGGGGGGGIVDILELDTKEVAEQITLIESGLFLQIRCTEFYNQSWKRPDARKRSSPYILAMVDRFNYVSYWVASSIVLHSDLKKRTATLKKFIELAQICHDLRNYSSLVAIIAGLNNSSIQRLKQTWAGIKGNLTHQFETLNELVEAKSNYKNYRETLLALIESKSNEPIVPYLGLYLRDLTVIDECNPDFIDEDLINLEKLTMIGEAIIQVEGFQRNGSYSFPPNPELQRNLLLKLLVLPEDILYKKSEAVEPNININ